MKLSVIIPARREFPSVVHTLYSIWQCWEADGFDSKEIEIIIIDNVSDDFQDPKFDPHKPGTRGTISYLMPRGAFHNRAVRVIYDPIAGNHSARNKGAKIARGEYLFFSDAHMAYKVSFFKNILETVEKYGGLVHGGLQFMGAWPVTDSGMGFQYTLKAGDQFRETWANYKLADTPWYIIGQGAWGMAVKRDEFFKFGGYEDPHRTYGGEFYISKKWWMLGGIVMVDPRAVGFHLASIRGYNYQYSDYIENILGLLYALGADDWRERTYINYLRTHSKATLDAIMERGEREYAKDREWIAKRKKYTFNELLTQRPWEKKNIELYGKSNCGMLFYHYSELDLIMQSPVAMEAYRNSKYQKQLAQFIQTELKDYIYRPQLYPDLTRFKEMTE